MNVNSPTFPSKDRVKNILREVDQARQAIEKAPAADCFESSRTRVLSKAQGNYVAGSVHHVSWMTAPDKVVATSNDGQTTVKLSSETFKQINRSTRITGSNGGEALLLSWTKR